MWKLANQTFIGYRYTYDGYDLWVYPVTPDHYTIALQKGSDYFAIVYNWNQTELNHCLENAEICLTLLII